MGVAQGAAAAPPPSYEAANANTEQTAALQLHPLPAKDALIVQVRPPTTPPPGIKRHVPCDIVLVIDVSGSMGIRADVPGESDANGESPGLSVLDLTKHAALTIIETLDEGDRLGIVTFSSRAQVVQRLTPMTRSSKEAARRNVRGIKKQDATNLWHGLLDGVKLFREAEENANGRVPALMVLTDGKPNFMCPPAGYVPKLRSMLPLPASIHTFGFGYNLESGLLKSIAEIGGGNYAFIPDAGMIGTVFVHAVANLQSTFATNAVLELSYPKGLQIRECMGAYVDQQQPQETANGWQLSMNLGNLQYGQSRDIYLEVDGIAKLRDLSEKEKTQLSIVAAQITYKQSGSATTDTSIAQRSILDASTLPDNEVAYHESRTRICRFLASIFPLSVLEVHEPVEGDTLLDKRDELTLLIDDLPAQRYKDTDPRNRALVEDLDGAEPRGQVSLAVRSDVYFRRWGVHYLPSLLNAHTRQVCNSFKDQGPLQYSTGSPLFIACRDRLDDAFDNLPAPEPSLPPRVRIFSNGGAALPPSGHRTAFSMSRYHNPLGVCFAGSTPVELASSLKRSVPIRALRRGMMVRTPVGARRVAAVLKTRVDGETLCRVPGGVLVTPWHPIASGEGKQWVFPAQVAVGTVKYTGCVYSVLLQRDGDARAHAMRVGSIWGTTLGHGITAAKDGLGDDVRAHEFFGDYDRVAEALGQLGVKRNGIAVGRGVTRDENTGLVTGFRTAHN
jgi:Mg-chelatase subunit ChlD